jgi:hypothetical protein
MGLEDDFLAPDALTLTADFLNWLRSIGIGKGDKYYKFFGLELK